MANLRITLKTFLIAVFLISPLQGAASPVGQDNLDEGTSILALIDVPLMPGLEELMDMGVLFDKPDGRYVEVELVGEVPLNRASVFYRATMVNWGWVMGDDSTLKSLKYTKDGELLTMDLSDSDEGLLVKIRLKPVS